MSSHTKQPDLELLSAWLDGELDAPAAAAVERQLAEDPAWADALRELQAVDAAMDALPAPQLNRDLTEQILAKAHRQPAALGRVLRYLAPAAAAAAVIIACWVGLHRGTTPIDQPIAVAAIQLPPSVDAALKDVPAEDRLLVWKLDMFQHYGEVKAYQPVADVVDAETLAELNRQEGGL